MKNTDQKTNVTLGSTLAALGVVFGDIGTSPLYALRESLGGLPVDLFAVLGILSLIFWSLVIIISIKYLAIVFRADNNGEGGILALLALLKQKSTKYERFFYLLAIFGAGLLLGDGMLTPAISVTSAVEGLKTFAPELDGYILPISCVILFFLFIAQEKGTSKIGAVFGPIIMVWFITIAILGIIQIFNNPVVLNAINPYYGIHFLLHSGWQGYFLLGGVFLVVTGGEALYADIGHFGKNSIRLSWFTVVFPSLILNYFGQGAYLLLNPAAISNPFYMIAPAWFGIPLLVIATLATIIASQAVITATFSLAKQAVLLGFCPRISIIHTSKEFQGQIYVPQINFILAIGTFFLLLTFRSSSNLTHAYGIAVNLDMLLITLMIAYTALHIWRWPLIKVIAILSLFFLIDLAYLGANLHKFLTGGWVPVSFALVVGFIMYTWSFGLEYLREHFYHKKEELSKILKQLDYKALHQLKGVTSIFITDVYDKSGGSFLHFLRFSRAMPEHVLILSYVVENIPYVHYTKRYEVSCLSSKVCKLVLHYGFMDNISVPDALELANNRKILPFAINVEATTYIVEVPNIYASKKKRSFMFHFQEKIFAFLIRNYSANLNIEFYNLPYNKTIAIGAYFII
ncbi:KUP system potassium uptake protein [Legionella beliardensis]|uniref:Probable potassium transport system protein Kup n=1 Tax=Legionella beliardensis TaxID=91822 RepID=A0A378I308_9GAMM|nr:KUP/HAK/KT family potassium transporter [Legionella beliardensis]STX29373.1 KUP system potassium uptake protein [Legionella beliardensis]